MKAAAGILAGLALIGAYLWPRRAAAAVPPLAALPGGGVSPGIAPGMVQDSQLWNPPPLVWPSALPSFDGLIGQTVSGWLFNSLGPSDTALGGAVLGASPAAWLPPEPYRTSRAKFIQAAQRAEFANSLPSGLLVRLLWQESRFDPAARNGEAVGIAQIIPRWHPGVNALDPVASIDYAAAELARLFRRFRRWSTAVMAYHAGENGVASYLAGKSGSGVGPVTVAYATAITRDVGVT